MDQDEPAATVESLLAAMKLDVAVSWVCWTCQVQGRFAHPNIDSARHDAVGHAIGVHRERLALMQIALITVSEEGRAARRLPEDLQEVPLVPRVERWDDMPPLTGLQQMLVCDALGCDPQSRHRRKLQAEWDAAVGQARQEERAAARPVVLRPV
ncbi:hypothetical protein ACFQ0T_43310 [Kitasatospora gansuensis]